MSDSNSTPQEVWKAIPDFPGYDASDQGRVRSYWKYTGNGDGAHILDYPQKILLSKKRPNYHGVTLCRNGEHFSRLIHRLVLEVFVGPCPPGLEGCHNDGDVSNCFLTNLRWDTPKNNHADKVGHGTQQVGEKNGFSKLTEPQVIQIRQLYATGVKSRILREMFHVSKSTIEHILSRRRWSHV
jgi:hypothetical protein